MNTTLVYIIAIVVSFGVTAILGKFLIPFLRKLNFGQTIREVGPSWHKDKEGTPTMGGVMFMIGMTVALIVCIPMLSTTELVGTPLMTTKLIAGAAMSLCFGVIGFIDDYISIKKKRNKGLSEKQKLVLQFLVVAGYLFSVFLAGGTSTTVIPFVGRVDLGFFYYILSALVIVGMVNAVNFTDGIDGLNSMVCFASFAMLAVCAVILKMTGITLLGIIAASACIGFLVWNFHPAKVFMGDTGSLFLGGVLCALAFGIDMPVLLLPVGIVSIVEIISVVLQVTYFKKTGGKRLFKMAPIHHHFEMKGWSEYKICFIFSGISLLGGVIAVVLVAFGV